MPVKRNFQKIAWLVAVAVVLCLFGCQTTEQQVKEDTPQETLPAGGSLVSSGKFRALAIADLDNDGIQDIVGGAVDRTSINIWYGIQGGLFKKPVRLPFKAEVYSIAVADVNEDGLKDLILAVQKEISGIMVWLNGLDGGWKIGVNPTSLNNYQSVKTADINSDGHIDLVAANSTADVHGGVQLWFGDGKGNWKFEAGPTITGIFMDVVMADFNSDGKLDIAGAGWGAYGAVRVWLGDGDGGWQATELIGRGSFYRLTPADMNGDGHHDLLAGTYREGVRIFSGDGRGGFTETAGPGYLRETLKDRDGSDTSYFDKMKKINSFWQAVPLDLDRDGQMEVVAGSPENNGMQLWKMTGQDKWAQIKGGFPRTGSFYDIRATDVDGDGQQDICAASFGEGIKFWNGKGGEFAAAKIAVSSDSYDSAKEQVVEQVQENSNFVMVNGRPEYKIGPKDVLEIIIWQGGKSEKEEVHVGPDGTISTGFIQDLEAAGLTEKELDDKMTRLLKRYIKAPAVEIRVKKYRSHSIMVLGAIVNREGKGPGRYVLSGRTTVLEAISMAGGHRLDANLSAIIVRGRDGKSQTLNLYKTMLEGDESHNIFVDDDDVIYVPQLSKEDNRVYVFGEVAKPGIVTFKRGQISMFDAIAQAGGVTIFAYEEETRIVRGDITQPEVMLADYEALVEEGDQTQNIALQNGDLVYVPRSAMGSVNRFVKRIRPLLELIYVPGRIARDIEDIENAIER